MVKPKRILEFGSFTGYSTICLSEGLTPQGEIHTVEINDELENIHEKYFKKAGVLDKITRYYGHALDIIKSEKLEGKYDLIWLDADKEHQIEYADFAISKLNRGGWLLIDNAIWGGAVIDNKKLAKPKSGGSRIHKLNQFILNHKEVENVLLPVWDGVQIVRKI